MPRRAAVLGPETSAWNTGDISAYAVVIKQHSNNFNSINLTRARALNSSFKGPPFEKLFHEPTTDDGTLTWTKNKAR
jgi:N-acetylmuramoyl-L-alanine amidase CwlA